MGEGHIPVKAVDEMIRMVKPGKAVEGGGKFLYTKRVTNLTWSMTFYFIFILGGTIFIVMREEYLSYVQEYANRLEPHFDELQEQGLWNQVWSLIFFVYCNTSVKIFKFKYTTVQRETRIMNTFENLQYRSPGKLWRVIRLTRMGWCLVMRFFSKKVPAALPFATFFLCFENDYTDFKRNQSLQSVYVDKTRKYIKNKNK